MAPEFYLLLLALLIGIVAVGLSNPKGWFQCPGCNASMDRRGVCDKCMGTDSREDDGQ